MRSILRYIKQELTQINIPYSFMTWKRKREYPYFVGEIFRIRTDGEDGKEEYSFLLTGFTRNSYDDLIEIAEKIEINYPNVAGKIGIFEESCIAMFVTDITPLPTEDEELKKIQINLQINRWKGKIEC